jgi:hypothetical protein
MEIVDEKIIETPSTNSSERFAFAAPRFPWSYAGQLMAITWAVEAAMEPKGEADRVTFVLGPDGNEVRP